MAMTRAEVREAFREVMAADYADVPKREEIDHAFSPEFYARMDTLIAEQKRGTWGMMPRQCKRVLVIAAILAVTLMLVACSPVLRHAVEKLVVTIYETFADFTVDTDKSELRMNIEIVYDFNPEISSFKMISQSWINPYRVDTIYENSTHDRVVVIQTISEKFIATADVERGETMPKAIEGLDVLFSAEGDIRTAATIHDGYFFTIRYIGEIDQSNFELLVASLLGID